MKMSWCFPLQNNSNQPAAHGSHRQFP